jgi:hypothetical protein
MLSSASSLAAAVAHRAEDRQRLVVEVQRLLLLILERSRQLAMLVQNGPASLPLRSPTAPKTGSAWL